MTIVDSNILLDILSRDQKWESRSRAALKSRSLSGSIFYLDVVFAEVSVSFPSADACGRFMTQSQLQHSVMTPSALWLAGQAFVRYRRQGGVKTSVLPDFFIGAQAQASGLPILTRDPRRYAQYFPDVELIAP